jgi:hypothetical protein
LGIVSLASCEMSDPTNALRSLTSLLHHMRVPGRPVGPPPPAMSWGMLVGVIPLVKITITTSRTYLNAPVHPFPTLPTSEPLTWATLQREGHNGPDLGTCHLERDTLTVIFVYGAHVRVSCVAGPAPKKDHMLPIFKKGSCGSSAPTHSSIGPGTIAPELEGIVARVGTPLTSKPPTPHFMGPLPL